MPPVTAKLAGEMLLQDAEESGGWGVVSAPGVTAAYGIVSFGKKDGPRGPGLDIAGIRIAGAHAPREEVNKWRSGVPTPTNAIPLVFGPNLTKDACSRDFTCNAVYYDPVGGLLLDPTGHGIQDAQEGVLRLASAEYIEKNETLTLRYAKMRLLDFTTDPGLIRALRTNATLFLHKGEAMVGPLARMMPAGLTTEAQVRQRVKELAEVLARDFRVTDELNPVALLDGHVSDVFRQYATLHSLPLSHPVSLADGGAERPGPSRK